MKLYNQPQFDVFNFNEELLTASTNKPVQNDEEKKDNGSVDLPFQPF